MTVHEREDVVVARLHALGPHLDGEPDPAFREATRARLVAMAAVRTPAPEPVSGIRRLFSRAEEVAASRWRSRLTAGLAGAALTVTALASLVAVSTGAGPGDVLYGIKRGTEQTQLALAGDERGAVLLDLARTRLHELEDLASSGTSALPAAAAPVTDDGMAVSAAGVDTSLVLETLDTMDDQTVEGSAWMTRQAVETGDGALLAELATWSQEQKAGLTALRDQLPDSTLDEVGESLGILGDIDVRTVALTDALDCAAGVPIESTDALGPVPGVCAPAPATPPVAGGENEAPGSVPAPGTQPAPGSSPAGETASPSGGAGPGAPETGEGTGGLPLPNPGGEETTGGTPSLPTLPLPLPTTLPNLPGGGSATTTSPPAPTASSTPKTTPPTLLPCLPIPPLINC